MRPRQRKLTMEQREQMRAMKAAGEKLEYLAALFGVSRQCVDYHIYAKVAETRRRHSRKAA
ncbi:MAG TPA: hypothetical protein VEA35_00605 [Ramlibacter sp.]|nr:hypothetical protein [Ramlibacter sp.]